MCCMKIGYRLLHFLEQTGCEGHHASTLFRVRHGWLLRCKIRPTEKPLGDASPEAGAEAVESFATQQHLPPPILTTASPPLPPRHLYRHAVTDNQARSRVAAPTQCRCPNCDPPILQQIRDHRRCFVACRAGERPPGKKSSAASRHRHTWLAGQTTDRAQEDDKPFEIRLSDEAFETYELDPPPYTLDVTKKELKQMYYDMVAVR